jgi:hypothetical protein
MHVPKTRSLLRISALIFVAFLAWLAFQAFQPPPGRPSISVNLLGYTNDNFGTRLAMISVTNLSAFPIYLYQPRIEISAQTRGVYPQSIYVGQWHSTLDGGASGSFKIPPPTNEPTWKLSFLVCKDVGAAQMIQRIISGVGRQLPSRIEGDWMGSEK